MSESSHARALPPGTVLAGYRLIALLGVGGFGITYLATEIAVERKVTIKEYLPDGIAVRSRDGVSVQPLTSADDEIFRWGLERFRREAQTLLAFQHPNILSVDRFFEANGTAYLVMGYEEGESLAAILESKKTLGEGELRAILDPLLSGLEHVHAAGFLHRDIEPRNIYIRRDRSPVLLNFGAARLAVAARSQNLTAIVTAGYAPFEQYTTRGNQGPWTDIYALGGVLYRAVVGQRPPDAPERIRDDPLVPAARAAAGKYSDALLQAVDAALEVDEEKRPQSVPVWRAMLSGERRMARFFEQPSSRRVRSHDFSGSPTFSMAAPAVDDMPADLLAALAARREASPEPGAYASRRADAASRPSASATVASAPASRSSASAWRWVAGAAIAAALIAAAGWFGLKAIGVLGAIKLKVGAEEEAKSLADCTVYAPPAIARGEEILVQVFVHPPEAGDDVDVAALDSDSAARKRGFASLSIDVPLGARIAFSLAAPGLEVEEGDGHEIVWRDRIASVQFLLRAPAAAALGRTVATVRAAVDGVPAGMIRFVLEVKASGRTAPAPQGERASRFSSAYVCYASQDRAEVLKRVQMLPRVGIRYFQDVLDLSPGERWEAALYRHIDASDLFLLFWSSNAKASDWVKKEVLYALERQKRDDGEPSIIPVLLEGPPPVPPPPELAHLHFNDPLLYFMSDARRA